jgi:hypothetical protein
MELCRATVLKQKMAESGGQAAPDTSPSLGGGSSRVTP